MTTVEPDLESVEKTALEHLSAEAGAVEADVDAVAPGVEIEPEGSPPPLLRLALAVAFPTIAAAVMVGGVFTGVGARFYAGVAGLLGVALAAAASRLRRAVVLYLIVLAGLFFVGVLMAVPSGLGNVTSLASLTSAAAHAGDVLRPPVPLTPGWQAIIGWLMGIVGFTAAWLAIVARRAPLGLLVPLPLAGIAGISVPKTAQVASGIVVLVLFAIGLGILSSATAAGAEAEEKPPPGYELRRALRALPLLIVITVALALLAKAHVLFPRPYIDPTQQPQRPRSVPLSAVEDRVLFEVESVASGPWRLGSLDVYKDNAWRLPPFGQNKLKDVPRSGVVDPDLAPGVKATFNIAGLGGAVLPGLPNTVGVVAEGPKLSYDGRNGNIRLVQGQVQAGLKYSVVAATLPSIDDLKGDSTPLPSSLKKFTDIPPPPPAVTDLIDKAPKTSKWEEFDYLRTYVLSNVTAVGVGAPKDVPPEKVQDMLAGSKEGSPFEIVAAQAMLARWAGIPSRIGYGFDGGDPVGGKLQVRPRNGASFVEVYFPNFKWLPVIGTPKKAKPTVGNKPSQQQFNPDVLPSDDLEVQLFVPVLTKPPSTFTKQLRVILLIGVPALLLLLLGYAIWPALRKTVVRSRRRTAAQASGPRSRVALAYSEWRDAATDFGYRYVTDTPFMFLNRFPEDAEHTELAWLVTRALWGDLQDNVTTDVAIAAEELSRSLRRRLAQAHPATVRAVAAISRLSLRDPFAPDLNHLLSEEGRRAPSAA